MSGTGPQRGPGEAGKRRREQASTLEAEGLGVFVARALVPRCCGAGARGRANYLSGRTEFLRILAGSRPIRTPAYC